MQDVLSKYCFYYGICAFHMDESVHDKLSHIIIHIKYLRQLFASLHLTKVIVFDNAAAFTNDDLV